MGFFWLSRHHSAGSGGDRRAGEVSAFVNPARGWKCLDEGQRAAAAAAAALWFVAASVRADAQRDAGAGRLCGLLRRMPRRGAAGRAGLADPARGRPHARAAARRQRPYLASLRFRPASCGGGRHGGAGSRLRKRHARLRLASSRPRRSTLFWPTSRAQWPRRERQYQAERSSG